MTCSRKYSVILHIQADLNGHTTYIAKIMLCQPWFWALQICLLFTCTAMASSLVIWHVCIVNQISENVCKHIWLSRQNNDVLGINDCQPVLALALLLAVYLAGEDLVVNLNTRAHSFSFLLPIVYASVSWFVHYKESTHILCLHIEAGQVMCVLQSYVYCSESKLCSELQHIVVT